MSRIVQPALKRPTQVFYFSLVKLSEVVAIVDETWTGFPRPRYGMDSKELRVCHMRDLRVGI